MLKYIFIAAKSTLKTVFLLTPAGIGDFKSVIRISPSYKNKTKKKQSSSSYSKPFYHEKTIKQSVTAPLPWDIQPGFWTLRMKQYVLKPGKPNTPRNTSTESRKQQNRGISSDWVGVSVCLFGYFFSQACWGVPGAVQVFSCVPSKRVPVGLTA